MENLIYWHGVAVGIEGIGGRVTWFTSAPKEAIAELGAAS